MNVPVVGISCPTDLESIVFVSNNSKKKFYFYKQNSNFSSTSFTFYERTVEDSQILDALESLCQYGALAFDITLKRKKFKCSVLTIPYLKEELFVYLCDALRDIYPLSEIYLQFESKDIYHDCDFHLGDLYEIGYGQFTKTASWSNGLIPDSCFVGFILCAAIPSYFEEPVYDFIEFDFSQGFYLRITLYQTYESRIYSRPTIHKHVKKVLDELPISTDRKTEFWNLWEITKTIEVYESDLNITDFQSWSCLWLLISISHLFDVFDSYKINPKIICSYKLSQSISTPLP